MDMNRDVAGSSRKRKRSHPSVSSDLEPASFAADTEMGDNGCDRRKAPVSPGLNAELDDSVSQFSPGTPDTSAIKRIPREKLSKDYERRSRHKTREDRYEVKEVKETKKQKRKKDVGAPKKERKRKGKKSGAAVMHDFTAQNVAHDRLTVRLL